MKKRALGRTGLMVSEIGVGAWQLGGPLRLDGRTDGHPDLGRENVLALIRACGERGINLIDTAEQYGAGESERRVGEAIAGQRDRWVVCTKFGALVGPRGERITDVSAARVPLSLEGSLRRLRTDSIDVYLYHTPPDPKEAEGVARVLETAKRSGKVRAVGSSTDRLDQCRFLLGLGCLDVVELPQNILEPREELTAFLAANGIGAIVRGAFAHGRLSGAGRHTVELVHPRRRDVGVRPLCRLRGSGHGVAIDGPARSAVPARPAHDRDHHPGRKDHRGLRRGDRGIGAAAAPARGRRPPGRASPPAWGLGAHLYVLCTLSHIYPRK